MDGRVEGKFQSLAETINLRIAKMTPTAVSKQHNWKEWLGLFGIFTSHLIAFCVLYLALTRFVPSLKLHYATGGITPTPIFSRLEVYSDIFVQYSLITLGLIFANAIIIVLLSKYLPCWLSMYSHVVHSCIAVMLLLSFSWMLNPLFSIGIVKANASIPVPSSPNGLTDESTK